MWLLPVPDVPRDRRDRRRDRARWRSSTKVRSQLYLGLLVGRRRAAGVLHQAARLGLASGQRPLRALPGPTAPPSRCNPEARRRSPFDTDRVPCLEWRGHRFGVKETGSDRRPRTLGRKLSVALRASRSQGCGGGERARCRARRTDGAGRDRGDRRRRRPACRDDVAGRDADRRALARRRDGGEPAPRSRARRSSSTPQVQGRATRSRCVPPPPTRARPCC